ncbi:MAG: 16S rRNA (guanine(527)-N(7))-methyltransferase RsmG [Paracoccaceae bacterium]|nr:16S rRNA (guanine(527)-N(7))-methyltransferase RsmG [Paracoccaceae bacterium]
MHVLDDVSRETIERLNMLEALVRKWNPTINLVSPKTLDELGHRHISDSAQLMSLVHKDPQTWCDLGSGGGFPGLVIATILAERYPQAKLTMIESDKRKAVFLRSASRDLGLQAIVLNERIETAPPQTANYVSARALAPLDQLLPLIQRHISEHGTAILPKGAQWQDEVTQARKSWSFHCDIHRSMTNSEAVILELKDITHA